MFKGKFTIGGKETIVGRLWQGRLGEAGFSPKVARGGVNPWHGLMTLNGGQAGPNVDGALAKGRHALRPMRRSLPLSLRPCRRRLVLAMSPDPGGGAIWVRNKGAVAPSI